MLSDKVCEFILVFDVHVLSVQNNSVILVILVLLLISGISGKHRNLYQANRFRELYQLVFHRTEVSISPQMEACM